jgi:hypothetical protein
VSTLERFPEVTKVGSEWLNLNGEWTCPSVSLELGRISAGWLHASGVALFNDHNFLVVKAQHQ